MLAEHDIVLTISLSGKVFDIFPEVLMKIAESASWDLANSKRYFVREIE